MSYTAVATAVTGATYTAANYNTYVRDNISTLWVYTTGGDIAYASSATALTRLGIGASGTALTSNGSVPSWNYFPLTYCKGGATVDQTIPLTGSYLTVAWDTTGANSVTAWHSNVTNNDRIKPTVSGYFQAFASVQCARSGADEIFDAYICLNGAQTWKARSFSSGGYITTCVIVAFPFPMNGTTDYVNVQIGQRSPDATGTMSAAFSYFWLLRLQ